MATIGNQVVSTTYIVDVFSGNASTTAFTLSYAPAATTSIAVYISGIYQAPSSYTINGTTLNFTSAPASGTNNIQVLHLAIGSIAGVPSDGSVTDAKVVSVANTKITGVMTASQLANTAVTSGVYGGATAVPVLTIDQQGRITSASNVSVTATSNGMFSYVSSALGVLPDTGGTVTPIKILGQIQTTANTLTNAYVVGAATQGVISSVTVCNQSANNVLVDVFARYGGTALGNQHYLVYQYALGAADTLVLEPRLTMNATSVLAANVTGANAASNVSVNVFGIEVK